MTSALPLPTAQRATGWAHSVFAKRLLRNRRQMAMERPLLLLWETLWANGSSSRTSSKEYQERSESSTLLMVRRNAVPHAALLPFRSTDLTLLLKLQSPSTRQRLAPTYSDCESCSLADNQTLRRLALMAVSVCMMRSRILSSGRLSVRQPRERGWLHKHRRAKTKSLTSRLRRTSHRFLNGLVFIKRQQV